MNRKDLSYYDPGRWFQTPIEFFEIVPEPEAVLLAVLVNVYCMKTESGELEHGGWVRLSDDRIRAYLPHHTTNTIHTRLSRLTNYGIVEVARRGLPARRWFRIIEQSIHDLVQTAHLAKRTSVQLSDPQGDGERVSIRSILPLPLLEETNEKKLSPASRGTMYVSSMKYVPYRDWANNLHSAICGVRKGVNGNPTVWAKHFKQLHVSDGVDCERITPVVEWYCKLFKRLGDLMRLPPPNYWPIAYSGATFREKFAKLEAAMFRDKGHRGEAIKKGTFKFIEESGSNNEA